MHIALWKVLAETASFNRISYNEEWTLSIVKILAT